MAKYSILLLFLVYAGLPTFADNDSLGSAWKTEVLQQIPTKGGELRMVQTGQDGYRFYLADRFIGELEGYFVNVRDSIGEGQNARFLLVGIETGGGSCPARYKILDIVSKDQAYFTVPFGNCSERPSLRLKGHDVEIDFPRTKGYLAQKWLYRPDKHCLQQLTGTFYPPPSAKCCN